ncbi:MULTISPECIES: DUF1609 domain-containing protein [unclassified Candidatus Cardinium]|uniref:DUF1609 domain-containing protein n=1 Tax=unclassified Candidatus Cardinium TaxID=2641185 RepID=UPI001FB3949C|nr:MULTISPECIES: DUF1609 domain-containing protein [unclassified Candidatus Cardinium]
MLAFFFYLKIILFFSCLAAQVQPYNEKIPLQHTESFLRLGRIVNFPGGSTAIENDSAYKKKYIEAFKKQFIGYGETNYKAKILDPFFTKEWDDCCLTPFSKITDYEKDKQHKLLAILKNIIVVNGHIFIGMGSILRYLDDQSVLNQQLVKKDFIRIEEIAQKAQMSCKNEAKMFGDVMYTALEDTLNYLDHLMKTAKKVGWKASNQFHGIFQAHKESLLLGFNNRNEILKLACQQHPEVGLALAYAQYAYRDKIDELGLDRQAMDLSPKVGNQHAALFYLEALTILQEAETQDQAKEKINQLFKNTEQTPAKTIDELVLEIESASKSNQKFKTEPSQRVGKKHLNSRRLKEKQRKVNNKNSESLEDTNNVSHSGESFCTLYQNTNEPVQSSTRLQSVAQLQERFDKSRYTIHHRVLRWSGATSDQIKNFDYNKMGKKIKYADFTEKDMMLQKAYHQLQGVELLLFVDDHADYFFKTSKGKSAFATFEIDGLMYEGILEIGISDKREIYHMMFNDKVKHRLEQLFEITDPILETLLEDSENNTKQFSDWCNKDGYAVEKQGDTYVITLNMPTSTIHAMNRSCNKLFIYPNKLLTKFTKNF